ncbi:MAG: class I SAM-dependent methyltransferase [Candidatus Poseidoniaceae archaeon]|jgi:demethylmenaquinone methyltransferase/2-methoxy-6-polyprenyl-1,4-benzoquinol methylase|nr:class I SAM-dependent methyltransferase [Candidatus Poseidoniaceae archaeon]
MSADRGSESLDRDGMGEAAWDELMRNLEATIPTYDKVNSIVTLGQDKRWRKNVASFIKPNMKVLEIGCGPGTFSENLQGVELTCLDPSEAMLEAARRRVGMARAARGEKDADFVLGVAEELPLADNTFDRVCCLFSFRDFHDKRKGLSEILRVLKPGGRLIICDAGKSNFLQGLAGRIWMGTVVQWVARRVTKDKEHPWKWLAKTYTHFGTISHYRKMMREVGFSDVRGRLYWPFFMAERFLATKPE